MSHSPLHSRLRRALLLAHLSTQTGIGASELVDQRLNLLTRRQFMRATVLGSAALVGGALTSCAATPVDPGSRPSAAPRIAIIGAGLAGLNCAYQLKKAGIRSTVYEAAQRFGGRCFTKQDVLGNGLITELGGEFIDSGCTDMQELVKEFSLPLLDLSEDTLVKQEAYYFGGRHYSESEVVEALKPFIERISLDATLVPQEPVNPLPIESMVRRAKSRRKYDLMCLSEYLDEKEIKGWLRALLEAAFVTEFGMDADEQSSLNFLSMIGTDMASGLRLLGESDERYKVEGGNQRVVDELANRLEGQIETERRLVSITKRDGAMDLTFARGKAEADMLVLALPFTMLREVDLKLDLPSEKQKAISELGYGMNAKVMFGTSADPGANRGFPETCFPMSHSSSPGIVRACKSVRAAQSRSIRGAARR